MCLVPAAERAQSSSLETWGTCELVGNNPWSRKKIFLMMINFVFTRLLVGREIVKFNSVSESGCTYSPAACCGGVKQQLPLGAVCVEGLVESNSNNNLTENTRVPPLKILFL